jgi:replication protein 2
MKKYTTKEASEVLGVNIRTIQRHVATLSDELSKSNNKKGVLIPEDVLNLIKNRLTNDSEKTPQRHEEFPYVEYFTEQEYEEFKRRITEYPLLKEQISISNEYLYSLKSQIEYFRASYNKQLEIHEKLIDSVKERNFIEAKEKGLDKK